jgi:hypothetical protein
MKPTVQAQLFPGAEAEPKLKALVEAFDAAADRVAGECFKGKTADIYEARSFAYRGVRERFGLSSRMAQHAIKVACDAYRRDKAIRPAGWGMGRSEAPLPCPADASDPGRTVRHAPGPPHERHDP